MDMKMLLVTLIGIAFITAYLLSKQYDSNTVHVRATGVGSVAVGVSNGTISTTTENNK